MAIVLVIALSFIGIGSSYSMGKQNCAKDVKQCEQQVLEKVNDSRSSTSKVNSIEEWREGK